MAYLNTLPTRRRRAPGNWARVTQYDGYVLRKVSRVGIGVFFGDLFRIEPEQAIESARVAVKSLC